MADIKLVIKIPEEVKQAFDCAESNDLKGCYYDHGGVIGNAIKNGTPLPKGYGRLVDLDKMCADYWDGNYMEIHEDDLPNIPIIIEADKSESEDKEYYDELRMRCPRTDEQWADFNILKEKLVIFAYKILGGRTNGDVIKALFYVKDVEEMECCTFVSIAGDADMRVYKDWWNATYEAESEESE